MRNWLFHPVVYYPLLAVAAVFLVLVSLRPDIGPMPAAAAVGRVAEGAVVIDGAALSHPDLGQDQVAHVVRDGLGRPIALRLAVLPGQPEPGPAETGARFLLTPDASARLGDNPVQLEITVRPLEVTTAAGIAVSLQGEGPAEWVRKDITPESQVVTFDLPPTPAPQAIGLRIISDLEDYNYGFEIVRLRLIPAGAAIRR